jgi:hypothetical protein
MKHNSFLMAIVAGLFVFVTAGCGGNPDSKYAKVEGTITYKQQPVDGANVSFLPVDANGESAAGKTDASGKFSLTSSQAVKGGQGLLPGEYRVLVSKSVTPVDPDEEAFSQGKITYDELQTRKSAKSQIPSPSAKDLLPEKYKQPGKTDLTATVEKGKVSTFNFDLTD